MTRYIVNKNAQSNGDHEVHAPRCSYMPDAANQLDLGEYNSCGPAVKKAKETYSQSNGCFYCSNACHTG